MSDPETAPLLGDDRDRATQSSASHADYKAVQSPAVPSPTAQAEHGDNHPSPKPSGGCCRLRSWVTVEPSVCLFLSAAMSYSVTFQQYVYKRVGDKYNFEPVTENCTSQIDTIEGQTEQDVQSESSQFMFLMSVVNLLPGLVPTLFLGHYSDLRGRKIAIILPFIGACARQTLVLAFIYMELNLFWFLLASSLESACGGIMTIIMSGFAYISDISSTRSRAIRIFLLEIVFLISSSTNSLITGYLIMYIGFEYTFLYQLALYVLGLMFALFYIQETITPKAGRFTLQWSHMTATFRIFIPGGDKGCRWDLILLLFLILLPVMADVGGHSVNTFFFLGWPVCFTSVSIGIYNAVATIAQSVISFLVLKILQRWLPDTVFPMLGAIMSITYFLMYGFSFNRTLIYIAPFVAAPKMLIVPLTRAIASKLVGPDEQGTMFAGIAFAEQFSLFAGSSLFSLIYYKTVFIYRGLVFFAAAGIQTITFILAIVLHCTTTHKKPETKYVTIGEEDIGDED